MTWILPVRFKDGISRAAGQVEGGWYKPIIGDMLYESGREFPQEEKQHDDPDQSRPAALPFPAAQR